VRQLTVATFSEDPAGVVDPEVLDASTHGLLAELDDGGLVLGSETVPAGPVVDGDVTVPAAEGVPPLSFELFGRTMTIRNPSSLVAA
jgi:hypothetical protein